MTVFSSLVQPFNVSPTLIPLQHGYHAACWAPPAALDPEHKQALYGALSEVGGLAYRADMSRFWRDRALGGYLDGISCFYFIYAEDDRLVGFTGYHRLELAGQTCLHLDSTGLLPEVQNTGIITELLGQALLEEMQRASPRNVYLTARTRSPLVYQFISKLAGERNTFPNLSLPMPDSVQELGVQLAAWLKQGQKLNAPSLLVKEAYESLDVVYGDCDDENTNRFFRLQLCPLDGFLVLGSLSGPHARMALSTMLGRGQSPNGPAPRTNVA